MHYFMVPAAQEILFSTGILFIPSSFSEIFRFCQIQGHFQDRKNLLYLKFSRTPGNPNYYRSSISLIFICTSSKLSKASTFNRNITTTYTRLPYLSVSNSKRGIIGACTLNAWTYNAEVQGSDARICNHFVKFNVSMYFSVFVL